MSSGLLLLFNTSSGVDYICFAWACCRSYFLFTKHEYTFQAYSLIAVKKGVCGIYDLACFRNPWGHGEFKAGGWFDGGPKWKEHPEAAAVSMLYVLLRFHPCELKAFLSHHVPGAGALAQSGS